MLKLSGPLASIPGLCLAQPSSVIIERLEQILPKTIEEWESWISSVQHNRVETQVLTSIKRHRINVPRWINSTLENRSSAVKLQNRLRRESFLKLLEALKTQRIPVILLKGNAISKEIYSDYDYKKMNDVDLLFKRESISKVQQIYNDLGLKSVASLEKVSQNQNLNSHLWPTYFNQDMSLIIGTHWNLVKSHSKIKIDPLDLWSRAENIEYEGYSILRLSKEDFIHHLCIQLSPHKVGAKELADIYNSISAWKSFNWHKFHSLVQAAHSFDAVYRALSLSQNLIFLSPIQLYIDSIRDSVDISVLNEIEYRSENPEDILLTRTSHIAVIEKYSTLFTLSEYPFEKSYFLLKIWQLILFPSLVEAAHLNFQVIPFSKVNQLICRTKAPLRILNSIAQDNGWNIFLGIVFQYHWDLVKSWGVFLFKFKIIGIKQKAQILGIDVQQLKTIAAFD